MYGLTMIKDYLNELLDGVKSYDARAYYTNKRGVIALVDSKTMKVFGYGNLVDVKEISPREYVDWHLTGRWSNCLLNIDEHKKYYAWIIKDIKREINPYKIKAEKHTWVPINV